MIDQELPKSPEQKAKVAASTFEAINKEYGKGTLQKLSSKDKAERIPSIPTGIITLDETMLGVGGIPRGTIVEIFGPESSGKTTLTLQVIAEAQKLGDLCAFIDAEHALDTSWAETNGVVVEDIFINQPDNGEQALDITIKLVESGAFGVIVVDSVAALVPQAELDGEMGDSHMGLQARLMSQAMRKLVGIVRKTKTTVIFINQIREKIGVMFGSPETTTGGRALKFYASVRIDIRRIGQVKDKDQIIGSRVKIKIVKNKVAAPFKEGEFDLLYTSGLDKISDLVDNAVKFNIIEKAGAWYTVEGQRFQGKDNVRESLLANSDIHSTIYKKVIGAIANA